MKVRRIFWFVAALVLAIPILIVLLVFLRLDQFVEKGVEIGGRNALGVNTELGGASVSLFKGSVELRELDVANPEGFSSPSFVKAGLIRFDMSPAELRKKELYVEEITLQGPEFTYEMKDGRSNFGVFMERLKGEETPEGQPKPPSEGEPIKLKVDLVRIADAKVHVLVAGRSVEASVPVIEIRNIADENGNAIPADQIVRVILEKVAGSIESAASGYIEEGRAAVEEKIQEELGGVKEKIQEEKERLQEQIDLNKVFGR